MAEIVWTPKALDDLESLLDYISKDAPAAARRFAQKLVSRVEMLGHHPLLGGFVAEDPEHVYRELRQGNYRVLYRTDGRMVYIVAIHRNLGWLGTGPFFGRKTHFAGKRLAENMDLSPSRGVTPHKESHGYRRRHIRCPLPAA